MRRTKESNSKFSKIRSDVKLVEASGAFDEVFYLKQLADKKLKQSNPIKHYLLDGWRKGFNPHPCFDTRFYLESNADVRNLNLHPFMHFINYGFKEARYISKNFFLPDYIRSHPESVENGANPLKHFTSQYRLLNDSKHIDNNKTTKEPNHTATQPLQKEPSKINELSKPKKDLGPLIKKEPKLTEEQIIEVVRSSSLFDENFYLSQYKDLEKCASLIEHYALFGGAEGRAASKLFDSKAYLDNNKDVTSSKINPLVHYETRGRLEGRARYPVIDATVKKSVSQKDIDAIRASNLFDDEYYSLKYPDVLNSPYTPEEHFLLIGGTEGREASRFFNCKMYLEIYEDVKNSGMNPLIHYLNYGMQEKRVAFECDHAPLLDAARSKTTLILDNLPELPNLDHKRFRSALLIHAYYYDVFLDIFNYAEKLPFSKIIVTTTPENRPKIQSFLEKNCKVNFRVSEVQSNRGRDIAPFLNENVDNLFDFDLICKVHTKKSPHLDTFGNKWKKHLIENLIGNLQNFNKIMSLFFTNPMLGIAYPEPMQGTNNYDWAENKDLTHGVFDRLGMPLSYEDTAELKYPPATMFWFRPTAIKQIFFSHDYCEFPEEPIHYDGTIAHAIERSINFVCKENGYHFLEYISLSTISGGDYKEIVILDWLDKNSDKEKFIVVSHEATNTGAPKTALSLLKELKEKNKACLTILLSGGEQERLFNEYGPVINYGGQGLRETPLRIFLENKDVNILCNTVVSYRAAKFFKSLGLPVISLVHEFFSSGHFSEEMFTSTIKNSDHVFFPAEFVLKDTLVNIDYQPTNIEIMPQGIYDNSFPKGNRQQSRNNLIQELGIPKDSIIVLSCGTIESRKGFDLLTDTAKIIFNKNGYEKVHFVWVGKGNPEDLFFQKCINIIKSDSELRARFHLVGAHAKVDRFFLAADIFALASRHDPFPGVVLEAMAASLPVLCYDGTTGVHEAFVPNVGGYVCKHLDYADMASRIMSLCRNQSQVRLMGEKNSKRVREKYNFNSYAQTIIERFHEKKSGITGANKFSIIVPVFNTPPNYLQKMIQSVLSQSYKNLELCIADASNNNLSLDIIKYYAELDDRVKYVLVPENKGIAENTNAALSIASGDYLCFVDHDDVLCISALKNINDRIEDCDPDVIYTDEDKVDEYGLNFFGPVNKPDFDINLLRQYNYITHLLCIRRNFFTSKISSLEPLYDGAQDYDMILRCIENTDRIEHIPELMYHWRVFENSTASGDSSSKTYAVEAGRLALEHHYIRQGFDMEVTLDKIAFRYIASPRATILEEHE